MSLMNASPAPEPSGNGTKVFCETTEPNSGNGSLRWKTMVRASGVSIVSSGPDRYGPS